MKINIDRLISNKKYCEEVFKLFIKKKVIRENKLKFFGKHINKALSNLEFANFLLEEHKNSIKEKLPNKTFYDWCIIIYYYAIYHTALALTTKAGYESKNHIATITAITLLYYHKDNILKKEEIEFLIEKISLEKNDINLVFDSKELRERASYGVDQSFELKQTMALKKEAVDFVNKIRGLIE